MKLKRLQSLLERVRVFDEPRVELEQYPTPPHLAAQIVQLMHRHGDVQGKAIGDLGVGCGVLTIATQLMGAAYNVAYDVDEAATDIARANFADMDCDVDVVHVDVLSMRREWRTGEEGEEEREEEMREEGPKPQRGKAASKGGRGRRAARPPPPARTQRGGGGQRPRASAKTQQRRAREAEGDSEEEGNEVAGSDEESLPAPPRLPSSRPHPPTSSPPSDDSDPRPSSSSPPYPPCVLDTVVLNPPFGTRHAGVDVAFLHVALQLSLHAVYSLHKTATRAFFHRLCQQWQVHGEVVAEMRFELKRSYAFHKEKSRDVEVDLWRFTHTDRHRPARFSSSGHEPMQARAHAAAASLDQG